MIKIIFSLLFLGAMFLWCCNVEITFSPFRVRLPALLQAIGWLLIVLGIAMVNNYNKRQGDKEGYIRGLADYNKAMNNLIKSKENINQ